MCIFGKKTKSSKGLTFEIREYYTSANAGSKKQREAVLKDASKCKDSIIFIPAKYKGVTVARIDSNAFAQFSSVERVVIPRNVYNVAGLINPKVKIEYVKVDSESPFLKYEDGALFNIVAGKTNLARVFTTGGTLDLSRSPITKIDFNAFAKSDVRTLVIGKDVAEIDTHGQVDIDCCDIVRVRVDKDNPVFESKDNAVYKKETGALVMIGSECQKIYYPKSSSNLTSEEKEKFRKAEIKEIVVEEGCSELTYMEFCGSTAEKIVLPSSLKYIGQDVFADCLNLKELTIPLYEDSVIRGAFRNCRNLEIKFEGKSDKIAFDKDGALYNGTELIFMRNDGPIKEYTLREDTTAICDGVFSGRKELEKINLNANLKIIHRQAFAGCTSLKKIYLPDSVESVYSNAFLFCVNLRYIRIPKKLKGLDCSLDPKRTTLLYADSIISWNLMGKIHKKWNEYFINAGFKTKGDFTAKETDPAWTDL